MNQLFATFLCSQFAFLLHGSLFGFGILVILTKVVHTEFLPNKEGLKSCPPVASLSNTSLLLFVPHAPQTSINS